MKAANENKTTIYRIRRKEDGRFLESIGYGSPHALDAAVHWTSNGVFFWKTETVRRHLLELCQFRVYCSKGGTVYDKRKSHRGVHQKKRDAVNPFWVIYGCDEDKNIRLVKTVYEWLDLYEVIAHDVSIHGQVTMEAKDFASFQPVAEIGKAAR